MALERVVARLGHQGVHLPECQRVRVRQAPQRTRQRVVRRLARATGAGVELGRPRARGIKKLGAAPRLDAFHHRARQEPLSQMPVGGGAGWARRQAGTGARGRARGSARGATVPQPVPVPVPYMSVDTVKGFTVTTLTR